MPTRWPFTWKFAQDGSRTTVPAEPSTAVGNTTASTPVPLTQAQKAYIISLHCIGSALLNFFLIGLITWAVTPKGDGEYIPMTGKLTCVVSVVIVTTAALAAAISIIDTLLVRLDVRMGKIVRAADRNLVEKR